MKKFVPYLVFVALLSAMVGWQWWRASQNALRDRHHATIQAHPQGHMAAFATGG